jgi:hypothetical protein
MVGTTRFEHATPWSQTRCSTKLSYVPMTEKKTFLKKKPYAIRLQRMIMERVMGIEPTLSAWKAEVLPLNYTRVLIHKSDKMLRSEFRLLLRCS